MIAKYVTQNAIGVESRLPRSGTESGLDPRATSLPWKTTDEPACDRCGRITCMANPCYDLHCSTGEETISWKSLGAQANASISFHFRSTLHARHPRKQGLLSVSTSPTQCDLPHERAAGGFELAAYWTAGSLMCDSWISQAKACTVFVRLT